MLTSGKSLVDIPVSLTYVGWLKMDCFSFTFGTFTLKCNFTIISHYYLSTGAHLLGIKMNVIGPA